MSPNGNVIADCQRRCCVQGVFNFDESDLKYQKMLLKGLGHDWWSLFTIFFYPKLLYISSMKPSLNRKIIFKLIVHRIELHAGFEERENKQKNTKFEFKN